MKSQCLGAALVVCGCAISSGSAQVNGDWGESYALLDTSGLTTNQDLAHLGSMTKLDELGPVVTAAAQSEPLGWAPPAAAGNPSPSSSLTGLGELGGLGDLSAAQDAGYAGRSTAAASPGREPAVSSPGSAGWSEARCSWRSSRAPGSCGSGDHPDLTLQRRMQAGPRGLDAVALRDRGFFALETGRKSFASSGAAARLRLRREFLEKGESVREVTVQA